MTDKERINRLAEAHARLIAALALEMSAEAYALVFAAALLVADATPSVQLELFQDAPQRAVRAQDARKEHAA